MNIYSLPSDMTIIYCVSGTLYVQVSHSAYK